MYIYIYTQLDGFIDQATTVPQLQLVQKYRSRSSQVSSYIHPERPDISQLIPLNFPGFSGQFSGGFSRQVSHLLLPQRLLRAPHGRGGPGSAGQRERGQAPGAGDLLGPDGASVNRTSLQKERAPKWKKNGITTVHIYSDRNLSNEEKLSW